MPGEEAANPEWMYSRFRRLMMELMRGETTRNCFEPWEIEILLDVQTCELPARRRWDIMGQYDRAVRKQLETGPGPPMKLSEFLVLRERQRILRSRSD